MKKIAMLMSLLVSYAAAEEDKYDELTIKSGKVYKSVVVRSVTPSEIKIMHESGTAGIKLEDLPEDLQTKYGFDPEKAKEHRTAEQNKSRAQEMALDQAVAKVQQKEAAEKADGEKSAAIAKKTRANEFFVMQVLPDGLLVNNVEMAVVGGSMSSVGGGGNVHAYRKRGTSVFYVTNYPSASELTDGKSIEGMFYENGNYSYQDTLGATRTVPKYTYSGAIQKKR
jgi:hypothetical protein